MMVQQSPNEYSARLILILSVAFGTLGAGVCLAGVGSEVSNIAALDTAPPVVVVADISSNAVFLTGDEVTFVWQITEDNPSSLSQDYQATARDNGVIISTLDYYPDVTGRSWPWLIPDMPTSANIYFEVMAADAYGNQTLVQTDRFTVVNSVTAVPVPTQTFHLSPPTPNPFNPSTSLTFRLPEPGRVEMKIFDVRGRYIRTLVAGDKPAGEFNTRWQGMDSQGRRQPGGIYFFVLEYFLDGNRQIQTQKAILVP